MAIHCHWFSSKFMLEVMFENSIFPVCGPCSSLAYWSGVHANFSDLVRLLQWSEVWVLRESFLTLTWLYKSKFITKNWGVDQVSGLALEFGGPDVHKLKRTVWTLKFCHCTPVGHGPWPLGQGHTSNSSFTFPTGLCEWPGQEEQLGPLTPRQAGGGSGGFRNV